MIQTNKVLKKKLNKKIDKTIPKTSGWSSTKKRPTSAKKFQRLKTRYVVLLD